MKKAKRIQTRTTKNRIRPAHKVLWGDVFVWFFGGVGLSCFGGRGFSTVGGWLEVEPGVGYL